jgi:hypothetical protein
MRLGSRPAEALFPIGMQRDPHNPAKPDQEAEPSFELILCFLAGAALIGLLLANLLGGEW